MDENRVAASLRSIRVKLGLSQEEFGKLMGVGSITMGFYERAETSPRIESLIRLKKLGINIRPYLDGNSDDMFFMPEEVVRENIKQVLEAA